MSTPSTASTPSPPPPTILDLRNRSPSSPPLSPTHSPSDAASSAAGSPETTATSVHGDEDVDDKPLADPLREQIVKGLLGTKQPTVPGKDDADRAFSFTKRIPTMVVYSERGLELYEQITRTQAYYPFNAEKEILQQHGDEIACRMFGLPSAVLVGGNEKEKKTHEPSRAANSAADKEKWGDSSVGLHNYGVNGGLNHRQPLHSSMGLAVELGSGSLDKTRVLLRSMAKLLQPTKEGDEYGPMQSLDYKALDLEAESLRSTLSTLASVEGESVTTELQDSPASPPLGGKRRVSVSGLHATYDEGLAFLKAQAAAEAADGRSSTSPFSSPSSSPERLPAVDEEHESPTLAATAVSGDKPSKRATSILWLGSSIGNFTRSEAVSFLKGISLAEGDTMLIGVDGCADGPRIEEAYNDPEGVTRAFILEGVDVAGRTLGGKAEEVIKQENFEYVNRWNAKLGRHEAYVRAKKDLTVPLPDSPEGEVKLQAGELLAIEVSYKYTYAEALALFHLSGLRLIQHWTDSSQAHTLYLVERPRMWFPSPFKSAAKMLGIEEDEPERMKENTHGVPSLGEWEEMWRAWDGLMLEIFPPSLRFAKPIPLRHVPLFYIGHIPAFRDIHLSRVLNEPFTEPAAYTQAFERGIDPDLDDGECKHWHSEVPQTEADWPKVDEIVAYERRVRDRVRSTYERFDGKWTRRMARVMMMVFEHEQMHWETAVYIALQASSSLNLPPGTSIPDFPSLARSTARALAIETGPSVLSFDAQTVQLGHDDNDRDDHSTPYDPTHEFGWDCENPRREAQVGAFKISAKPVTNGEYLDWLVASGGVSAEEREKLTPASWAVSGEVKEEDLAVKTLFGEVEMQYAREWPVAASAEQLEAFAESKNARLPTIEEMAVFHQHHPAESPLANLGFAHLHPVPPTLPSPARDGSTLPATNGGLWQWTSSLLDKWDGFVGSEVYPGYSTDFHDGKHRIVVGGSYATPRRCARPSFVNYYQFNYPFMLGGARIVYNA